MQKSAVVRNMKSYMTSCNEYFEQQKKCELEFQNEYQKKLEEIKALDMNKNEQKRKQAIKLRKIGTSLMSNLKDIQKSVETIDDEWWKGKALHYKKKYLLENQKKKKYKYRRNIREVEESNEDDNEEDDDIIDSESSSL